MGQFDFLWQIFQRSACTHTGSYGQVLKSNIRRLVAGRLLFPSLTADRSVNALPPRHGHLLEPSVLRHQRLLPAWQITIALPTADERGRFT